MFLQNLISDNYENISFKANDGIILKGWFFNADSQEDNDKLIIFVTGATQNRINTGYYSVLIAKELLSQDYNVLMYDNRATGESEKQYNFWYLRKPGYY